MNDILVHFVVATNIGVLVMTLAWVLAVRLNFYSLGKAAWAYGFSVIALVLGFYGPGWEYRKWIFVLMLCCWSFRFGTFLLQRFKKNFPKEDPDYELLRTKWSDSLHWSFITYFLLLGISMSLLSIPMTVVAANDVPVLTIAEWMGFAVWCLSIVGVTIADDQLEKFEANPENAGKVCDVGLWKYLRHANFIFEVLVWCSFALFASGSPYGWLSWLCPLIVLGWRALSLSSRNHERFFPWLPKKIS